MHALCLLFRMRARGAFRSWWRACRSLHGAIRAILTLMFVMLMLVPMTVIFFENSEPVPEEAVSHAMFAIDTLFPMGIAFFFFLGVISPKSSESLNFQPAEVDFLFGAPFSRRQLLIYKLMGTVTAIASVTLLINCLLGGIYVFVKGSFVGAFIRGYFSLALSFLLMQLLLVLTGLVRKSIVQRLISPLRKILLLALAIVVGVTVYTVAPEFRTDNFQDPEKAFAVFKSAVESDAFRIGIAPFRVFSNLVLAETWIEALLWGGIALAANALVLSLILRTDANFIEREIRYSQIRAEMQKKAASVESAFMLNLKSATRTIPMLPFWGGIGPIAWRQLQTFYRTKKILIIAVVLYFLLILAMIAGDQRGNPSQERFLAVTLVVGMATFTAALSMPMGFVTDIDKMDIFKSLPYSCFQIAAGQLLAPVLTLAFFQWVTFFVFLFTALDFAGYWFAAAAFAPLITTVLLSMLNTLSLLYPKRKGKGAVNEFENVGYILVFVILLLTSCAIVASALAGVGTLVYYLGGGVGSVFISCWLVMLCATTLGIWSTGWAFERFDVSRVWD